MRKVNIHFGGDIEVNWASLSMAIETYRNIAAQYGLIMPRGAFLPVFAHNSDALIGLQVRWEKRELDESEIQTFNEVWFGIATQYNIARFDTVVTYYEE